MIFQRGNPLDYERWGADPGMGTWDYAHCLPYFMRMENCLAAGARRPFRGHSGPLVLERGPATNPLFGAFLQAVQEAGYPLTDDVNGFRQEGFAKFDRNVHRGRRLSAARAYLHPGDVAPEPRRPHERAGHEGGVRGHAGRSASSTRASGGGRRTGWTRARSCWRAARSTHRSCCSCPGWATRRCCAAWASRWSPTCPAWARTSRTTWRSTCSTRARSRCRCSPTSRRGTGRGSARGGCSCAAGPAPPTTSRRAASSAATTTSTTRT